MDVDYCVVEEVTKREYVKWKKNADVDLYGVAMSFAKCVDTEKKNMFAINKHELSYILKTNSPSLKRP